MGAKRSIVVDLPHPLTCICGGKVEFCTAAVPLTFIDPDTGEFKWENIPPWDKVKAATVCPCGRAYGFHIGTALDGKLSVTEVDLEITNNGDSFRNSP